MIKQAQYIIKGMNRDTSISKVSPEFSFENMNIRITARDHDTLLSITNERGNREIPNVTINGVLLGYCVLNEYLILFHKTTEDNLDYISLVTETDNRFSLNTLYSGNLNFNTLNPIESVGIYENENIQKVYWVDGLNQPRMINIKEDVTRFNNTYFNFIRPIGGNEEINIVKKSLSSGIFAPGVIQYSFSYYTLHGQESNIFYTSPLYYISYVDRGGSPEDRIGNAFQIDLKNLNTNFEYVRVYSTLRTSIDATVEAKRVIDLVINPDGTASFMDIGTIGDSIDPTLLLYIGGETITAGTMAHKDNTLFLGDIKLDEDDEDDLEEFKTYINNRRERENLDNNFLLKDTGITMKSEGFYPYDIQLNNPSSNILSFKRRENYRFGLQLKDKLGKWSEPIWIGDATNNNISPTVDNNILKLVQYKYSITDKEQLTMLASKGYIAIRPLAVYPKEPVRNCICQGVLNPTVYNVEDRASNTPFSQASWYFRPAYRITESVDPTATLDKFNNSDDSLFMYFTGDLSDLASINKLGLSRILEHALSGQILKIITSKGTLEYTLQWSPEVDSSYIKVEVVSNTTMGFSFKLEFQAKRPESPVIDLQVGEFYDVDIPDIQEAVRNLSPMYTQGYDLSNVSIRKPDSWEGGAFKIQFLGRVTNPITSESEGANRGAALEFRHNYPIPSCTLRGAEIQCIYEPPSSPTTTEDIPNWVSENKQNFYVDRSIVTLNSPDIEFNTEVGYMDVSSLSLKIVGIIPLTGFTGDISITTSTPPLNYAKQTVIAPGFYKEPVEAENIDKANGYKVLASGVFWLDEVMDNEDAERSNPNYLNTGFVVYPWHRSGSLNNSYTVDGYRSSELEHKKISNLRYSNRTIYLDNLYSGIEEDDIQLFTSNEVEPIRLKQGDTSIIYYGNVDKIVSSISRIEIEDDDLVGYPIVKTGTQEYRNGIIEPTNHQLFNGTYQIFLNSDYGLDGVRRFSTDPVSIKYKSTPHAVITLRPNNTSNNTRQASLNIIGDSKSVTIEGNYFWDTNLTGYVQNSLYIDKPEEGYLLVGELIQNITKEQAFGGFSKDALESCQWVVCGDETSLYSDEKVKDTIDIYFTEGDTYYQRYDCLKTYPFTLEDTNSIVEILSFMVETRVNLDGRYDRNRSQTSNLVMTPQNFNLINPVYSQTNNFFTYRILNDEMYKLNSFPNTITWSGEKQLGEEIDTWTHITMANTLDLDGDKGKVVSLNTYNNEIFCFQEKGISNILFNSRVQVPTSDGMPIELTNGLKVGGKRYMSNTIGCDNKWSIVESPRGIYFVDDLTNTLYLFSGQLHPLSDNLGFRQWIQEHSSLAVWNPKEFGSFISHYDRSNGDVYFVNKDHCLVFSELLNQFTSFMSYNEVPAMFNFKNKFYSIKNCKLWEQETGEYNMFYGEFKPYYITYRVAPEFPLDKTFNNIEFRADMWDNETLTDNTLTDLDVWNEYQRGHIDLVKELYKPSPLKKKFRIWRANIPRDESNMRDRIRNPWIYLKLSMNEENTYRTEFHDLIVKYFI